MRLVTALSALAVVASCQTRPSSPAEPPRIGSAATPHVVEGTDPAAPAPTIEDLDFLVGRWEGEAFGGWVEENWSPAKGGSMVGHFRLVADGEPVFYELMLITEVEGQLAIRVKHFQPDMTPWEEGAESVNFPLVRVEGTTAWFGGLTIHRTGDMIRMYLAMNEAGEVKEEVLSFRLAR